MSSRQPSAITPGTASRRWRRRSLVPQATTGVTSPVARRSMALASRSPTPHEPPTTRATGLSGHGGVHRASGALVGETTGVTTAVQPPSSRACDAVTSWIARCRSTPGLTQSRCTDASVRYVTTGTVTDPRARASPSAWLANGWVEMTRPAPATWRTRRAPSRPRVRRTLRWIHPSLSRSRRVEPQVPGSSRSCTKYNHRRSAPIRHGSSSATSSRRTT